MVDPRSFFHEGTMQICSSLDISEAMVNCHDFLKKYIPLENIGLTIYEPQLKSIRILALYGKNRKNNRHSQLLALNNAGLKYLRRIENREDDEPLVTLPSTARENPVVPLVAKRFGLRVGSYMILRLEVSNERLGVVFIHSQQDNVFTPEHADLLALLHDPFAIALSNNVRYREIMRLQELLNDDNRFLRRELHRLAGDEIIGQNFGLREVMEMVRQVSALDSNVLLLGETGVGKEVIANAIHYHSHRASESMIKVNCGAIPESIMDSELFGHEKGAFTGALAQKRGRFERAHNGTIFLDEIAELPPAAQVRLLRVLQAREIERVGGTETIPVNVRIIAATNRNLERMVERGEFREDLWFRLNVFPITIPPLRMRKVDIPALVAYFIERKITQLNLAYSPVPAPGALERLQKYHWPGNVRELENAVEREIIRSHAKGPGQALEFREFGGRAEPPTAHEPDIAPDPELPPSLDQVIKEHIYRVMSQTQGKVQGPDGAAALLGLHPSTLRNRMRKLDIPFGRGRNTGE